VRTIERLATQRQVNSKMNCTVWTIGHSTRPLKTFLALLEHYRIEAVADVRRFPGSRRQPQFAQAPLGSALAEDGTAYHWIAALGGRRRPRSDSPNAAWRNLQFRGYADYMASKEFEEGVAELLEVAGHRRTTMMCAEAVWWRCHRALIADVLCVRGIKVVHIMDETRAVLHPYTSPARIVQGRLSYVPTEGKSLVQERDLENQQRLNPPMQPRK
jgi:uncharacterized protein (DUF488 family)